jgi:diguanylate cyclase (GGDEF)-like protein
VTDHDHGTLKLRGWSVRRRLIVLFAIMIIPFVGFSVYRAYDIRSHLETDALETNLRLARGVAHSIDDYLLSTVGLLRVVAESEVVRSGDTAALDAWLVTTLPEHPYYQNLIYVDNEGNIRAAGLKPEDPGAVVNVADTAYYVRSMESAGVAIGDFMYGKISGNPVVHICYPVYATDGSRAGFVAAAMNLTRVQDRLMREQTEAHTSISVLDRSGMVVARNHDPESWVGRSVWDEFRVAEMLELGEGSGETVLEDGTRLVCSYTEVESAPWFVRVGVNEDHLAHLTATEIGAHYAVFVPIALIAVAGWLWIGRDVDRLHRDTQRLSLIDPLTGLWNGRAMRDDMARVHGEAERVGGRFAVLMVDLDNFKVYNDRYGHAAGDEALKVAAAALRESVRVGDRVFRYGGEEFCVVLPDIAPDDATVVAERVREAVAHVVIIPRPSAQPVPLSVSIGVASYPDDAPTVHELIQRADEALYHAKRTGRNRVVAYRPAV